MVPITAAMAAFLALLHLCVGRLRAPGKTRKAPWLSMAGGAAAAYVFVHVFPNLCAGQNLIRNTNHPLADCFDHHIYLVSLFGLVLFYGLDRLALILRRGPNGPPLSQTSVVFWTHLASFAVFNTLIGYLLLHRESPGPLDLFWFFTAMALFMAVNDHGLYKHFKYAYQAAGRWVLAAAVILGWTLGLAVEISGEALAVLFAFLAGGVVMNVMKEEIPDQNAGNFLGFLFGAAGYTALLLLA